MPATILLPRAVMQRPRAPLLLQESAHMYTQPCPRRRRDAYFIRKLLRCHQVDASIR